MLSMIRADLACLRGSMKGNLLIALIVAVVLAVSMGGESGTGVAAAVAALASVLTVSSLNSLMAYDEQNSWQTFRLTFPVTRGQAVCARYATGLVCAVLSTAVSGCLVAGMTWAFDMLPGAASAAHVSLLSGPAAALLVPCLALSVGAPLFLLAVMLPFAFRLGFTSASRYVMAVFILFMVVVCAIGGGIVEAGSLPVETLAFLEDPASLLALSGAVLLGVAVLYGVSCCVSARLFGRRDL